MNDASPSSQTPVRRIPIRNRLIVRLLLSHIFLAAVPILIVGWILIGTAQRSIQSTVAEGNLALAVRAADEIGLYVQNALGIIREMAATPSMTGMDRWNQDFIINNAKRRNDIFERLSVLDRDGHETASTAFARTEGWTSRGPLFLQAIGGSGFISPVFMSEDRLPIITVSEPIIKFSVAVGVLVAEVNLKSMWTLVDSLVLGARGQAYVVGANGILIAHTEKRRVYAQEHFGPVPIVQDVLAGRKGYQVYTDSNGQQVIGACAPVPMLGWGVVIEQPTEEAFALAARMKMDIVLLIVGSIILASIVALVFTRKITRPIGALVSGTQLYSQGNLGYRIQPQSKDELGALAVEFDNMAASLLEIQKRLKRAERLATLSKFASIVSHEVRNPLNAMTINMQILKRELMKRGGGDPQMQQKYLNIVAAEIERLDGLVRSFLLMARPRDLKLSRCDISAVVDEVLQSQEVRAGKQSVCLVRDLKPDIACQVDIDQLKQVFLNIVVNALEAMPAGGQLTVSTCSTAAGSGERQDDLRGGRQQAMVSFTDTGPGIPPEETEAIFELYRSTKKGGTGLGLAIAQQIVEAHGGTIIVQNQVGRGATFQVILPVAHP